MSGGMVDKKVWVTRQPKYEQGDSVIISTSKPLKSGTARYSYYPGWIHCLNMSYRKFRECTDYTVTVKRGEAKRVAMSIDFYNL